MIIQGRAESTLTPTLEHQQAWTEPGLDRRSEHSATFGGLDLVPAERTAKVTGTGISWNYTTILNIIFLLVAAALVIRFVLSGGTPMLKMMGGSPAHNEQARGDAEPQLHGHALPVYENAHSAGRPS